MNRATYQRQWEQRERRYTARYSRLFYRTLSGIWIRAARSYQETGQFEVNESDFIPPYRRLYDRVTYAETKVAIENIPGEKDIIDAMAMMQQIEPGSEMVTFVRNLMQQYFNVYVMERLRQVTENTRTQILATIQQGLDEGLGGREVAKLIRKRAPELNRTRSIRIARTESVTAANKAQILAHEASPYVYEKAWLPVRDKRTRPSHAAMDPNRFIDLLEPFYVSDGFQLEEMIAPGDTNASAANVVNCRCVLLFKAKRDENGKLIRK